MNSLEFENTIDLTLIEEGEFALFKLVVNPDARLFKGHFPNLPILPGVVMLEMVKRAFEMAEGKKSVLVKAQNMKFLSVINPIVTPLAYLELKRKSEEEIIKVDARIFLEDKSFFKLKATYKTEE
jgi:3-hydroxyacyl-[acyl-carrier-protein] dehydratase